MHIFCETSKLINEKIIHKIIHYLKISKRMCMIFKTNQSKGDECYIDVDFAYGWNYINAENLDFLRTGYISMDCGLYLV